MVMCLSLALVAPADEVFDAHGLNPNRDFFSMLPYEYVDPLTGNVVLTVTDLVLPGNAGFDLAIQRTYNSKIYLDYDAYGDRLDDDTWAGVGWTLHLGRIRNPYAGVPGPVEMSDGRQHKLFNAIAPAGKFTTREFWLYNKANATLSLPNGLVYTYGQPVTLGTTSYLYVTKIADPFGNSVTVRYMSGGDDPPDGIETITQDLGNGQLREVSFTADPTYRSIASMTYLGRTWTYLPKGTLNAGYSLLTEVRPPVGPSWRYAYNEDIQPRYEIKTISTPNGGAISYTFRDQTFKLGSTAIVRSRALSQRRLSGRDIPPGSWVYAYAQGPGEDQSVILSPCGQTTTYTFSGVGNFTYTGAAWKVGLETRRDVSDEVKLFETTRLDWRPSVAVSGDEEILGLNVDHDIFVPLLERRTITRQGHDYVTTHFYDTANFNDYGRAYRTEELGELSRTTRRTFKYGFIPYIVDKTASETTTVSGESFASSYTYDLGTGFTTSETIYGIATTYAPTPRGNVASSEDANGKTTRYDYSWGLWKETETPLYAVTRQINPEGTVAWHKQRGYTTNFDYDDAFRLTLTTPPLGNPTTTEYDNAAGTYTRILRGTSKLTTYLDGFGRPSSTSNAVGIKTDLAYDVCGRKAYESYPYLTSNIGTAYAYDALDRVVLKTNPDASTMSYTFDGIDLDIKDEEQHLTQQHWSAFGDPDHGRLTSLTDARLQRWSYEYNAVGSLTRVDDPGTADREWRYYPTNLLKEEVQPENGLTSYDYYPAGNLKTRTDAEFGTTTFYYDDNTRLETIDRPGDTYDTEIGHDDSDNRTSVGNRNVGSTFEFDAANRLRKRTDVVNGTTFITEYEPDDNDNLRVLTYASGTRLTYSYDDANRIASMRDDVQTYADQFTYHPSGGVASYRAGNTLIHSTFYHPKRYWPEDVKPGAALLNLHYIYDHAGNVRTITDTRPSMKQSFLYDEIDRMTTANGAWGTGSFEYTATGDRKTKIIAGAKTTYTYGLATNRLLSASGAEPDQITYDDNGNTTKDRLGLYTYNQVNLMETATTGGVTTTYRYDGDDLRTLKIAPDKTSYYLHGPSGQILTELEKVGAGPTNPVRDYLYAGSRLIADVTPSVLKVDPLSLTFVAALTDPPPPDQSISITTSGQEPKPWRASENSPWLAVSPISGVSPAMVTASVNHQGLAPGTYVASITITAEGVAGSPQVVDVTLIVTATQELTVVPSTLTFTVSPGGQNPPPQTVNVLYPFESVSWNATVSEAWIQLSPAQGVTPGSSSVTVDPRGLARGTHTGTITVESPGVPGSPRAVTVELVVQPPPGTRCLEKAWYCETFDQMALGDLDGQGGWYVLPGNATAQVSRDPRGVGNVLVMDTPPLTFMKDTIDHPNHWVEGNEISMQIMTHGFDPDAENKEIAKIQFNTRPGEGWGKNGRTFGALRFGSRLYFEYGDNIYKILIPTMQDSRWYEVRVRFITGRIEVYVDGALKFSGGNPLPPDKPLQNFDTTAWDYPGSASLDLIQVRGLEPPPPELAVEPLSLDLQWSPETGLQHVDDLRGKTATAVPVELLSNQPVAFEPNLGQADASVDYVARGRNYGVLVRPTELVLALPPSEPHAGRRPARHATERPSRQGKTSLVRMTLNRASSAASLEALEPLPGESHYFGGSNPGAWTTHVPRYARVVARDVYPGIDLVLHGRSARLEYDFVVAPGADPRQIEWALEGASHVAVEANGDLVIRTRLGREVRQRRPQVYQDIDGKRVPIAGGYVLGKEKRIRIAVGAYDPGHPLVIDPIIDWTVAPDGGLSDYINDIATDHTGSVYLTGETGDYSFAPSQGETDWRQSAFVTKIGPDGSLIYSSALGGDGGETQGTGIAVDRTGAAYVLGMTESPDFPIVNAPPFGPQGNGDVFLSKLAPDGDHLVYSTRMGGTSLDQAWGLTVGTNGTAYVAGHTGSSDFPFTKPLCDSPYASFALAVAPDARSLTYSSCLAGALTPWVIAVNKAGQAYIAGSTYDDGAKFEWSFPCRPPGRAGNDGFVVHLTAPGDMDRSRCLGGFSVGDVTRAEAIVVDSKGRVYLTGTTDAPDFPLIDPIQDGAGGASDLFVMNLIPDLSRITFSTLLGGSGDDYAADLAIGRTGDVFIAGSTLSRADLPASFDFPIVNPLYGCPTYKDDSLLVRLRTDDYGIIYSTYLGGLVDLLIGTPTMAVAGDGDVYIAGSSYYEPTGPVVMKLVDGNAPQTPGTIQVTGFSGLDFIKLYEGQAVPFHVQRLGGSLGQAGLNYATADGSAKAPGDYTAVAGVLTLEENQCSATIPVTTYDDRVTEADETFSFSISNITGADPGQPTKVTATLWDTDLGPVAAFNIRDPGFPEGPSWGAWPSQPWLTIDQWWGYGPSTVKVFVDATGLVPGTYTGRIDVWSDGALGSPTAVDVQLTVLGDGIHARPSRPRPRE